MLLVPIHGKRQLLKYLAAVRENIGYSHPLSLKKVKKKGVIYACAESWVQVGVVSLMSRVRGRPEGIHLGLRERGRRQYSQFREKIGCKLIVFRERDDHAEMKWHRDYGSKVETTFRMGLKGGLHFLGSDAEPIHIVKMHFDGHKHYCRKVDRERIIGRLNSLRNYCSVAEQEDVIDDRASDHRKADSQEYGDCQLLQLTDLLIGCFRTVLGKATRDVHLEVSRPVKALIDRYLQGYARMQNSRWRDAFCLSQCYLESGQWEFETIQYERKTEASQLELPLG
jgi:hypothetical protein